MPIFDTQQFTSIINELHFLRPAWLWAIAGLVVVLGLQFRSRRISRSWQAVCDPELLPHILAAAPGRERRWPLFVMALVGILGILALAGPVWQQLEQPVFREQSALVIVLDLSRSMDATDTKPSRLVRARHKIIDILKRREEGQTALIVYAAEAFVVSPLTDDAETIIALVPSLTTSLMPTQGSRAELALAKAMQLLQQAGVPTGQMLLITDGVNHEVVGKTITDVQAKGHSLSILGVGTPDGAPIAIEGGGFLKDRNGSIVIPKLNAFELRQLALQGAGRYTPLTSDDSDMEILLSGFDVNHLNVQSEETGLKADIWREEGPWLLLFIIPFAALAFRRGYLVIALILFLPLPQTAYALSWSDLWSRPDQQGSQAFEQGNTVKAAELFKNPQWKAAAQYRAGDYQHSAEELEGINTPDALYNKANALARLGQMLDAIQAYDQALELDKDHKDARYNRDLLQQQMDQQQDQQQQGEGEEDQEGEDQQQSEGQQSDSKPDNNEAENSQGQENQDQQNQGQWGEQDQASTGQKQQDKAMASENESSDEGDDESQQAQMNQQAEDEAQQNDNEEQARQQATADLTEQTESQQAIEQWLRRIPDDPGGLLRRKFQYQSQINRRKQNKEEQQW